MIDIRMAYHEPGRAVRVADAKCAPGELQDAIGRIVNAWNTAIPRNHVRIVNQPRYIDLLAALRICTPEEICRAIAWYGCQTWQRQRNAWSTFDAFIAEDRLTQWVESSLEHAEHIAAAGVRRQAVQTTEDDKRKAIRPANERRRLQAEAFEALPPPRRYKLLEDAKKLLPPCLQRNAGQVRIRAIALLAAGGITKGKDSR